MKWQKEHFNTIKNKLMDTHTFNVYHHPKYHQQSEIFIKKYELMDFVSIGDKRFAKKMLKPIEQRKCRFCGKQYPDTKFSSYSHLFPKLLGYHNLYSDFECDECNHKFGFNESDLANFIGISRSIAALNNEGLGPTFKGKLISARSKIFSGDNFVVLAPQELSNDEKSLEERKNGIVRIPYTKNPYIPHNVYKALLKSALSILSNDEIEKHYTKTIKHLMGEIKLTGCLLSWFGLPLSINFIPHAYIFKKRNQNEPIHTHVIAFYFQNHIINIPIPLHNEDMPIGKVELSVPFTPPFFLSNEGLDSIDMLSYRNDMSSEIKQSDDVETLTLIKDRQSLEKLSAYDPATDTIKEMEGEPESIKYLIFTKPGFSVNPKEFSEFIKSEFGE